MSKQAASGNRMSLMDIMAMNAATQDAAQAAGQQGAAPAQAPGPTPMSAEEFYGGSNGRIGQPDQAYFNQFVLPGSQGYSQPRLLNPMLLGPATGYGVLNVNEDVGR